MPPHPPAAVMFTGWFKAGGEFFNNAQHPGKSARSAVAVTGLVSPDWLIEIEAFAVYPAPGQP